MQSCVRLGLTRRIRKIRTIRRNDGGLIISVTMTTIYSWWSIFFLKSNPDNKSWACSNKGPYGACKPPPPSTPGNVFIDSKSVSLSSLYHCFGKPRWEHNGGSELFQTTLIIPLSWVLGTIAIMNCPACRHPISAPSLPVSRLNAENQEAEETHISNPCVYAQCCSVRTSNRIDTHEVPLSPTGWASAWNHCIPIGGQASHLPRRLAGNRRDFNLVPSVGLVEPSSCGYVHQESLRCPNVIIITWSSRGSYVQKSI